MFDSIQFAGRSGWVRKVTDPQKWFKTFLREWFGGLLKGVDSEDFDEKQVFSEAGRACARMHGVEIFKKAWEESDGLEDFLVKINEEFGEVGVTYEKLGENTLSVTYPRCFCPLITETLVDHSASGGLLCNCSPYWLRECFKTILERDVEVVLEESVGRGAERCRFTISI